MNEICRNWIEFTVRIDGFRRDDVEHLLHSGDLRAGAAVDIMLFGGMLRVHLKHKNHHIGHITQLPDGSAPCRCTIDPYSTIELIDSKPNGLLEAYVKIKYFPSAPSPPSYGLSDPTVPLAPPKRNATALVHTASHEVDKINTDFGQREPQPAQKTPIATEPHLSATKSNDRYNILIGILFWISFPISGVLMMFYFLGIAIKAAIERKLELRKPPSPEEIAAAAQRQADFLKAEKQREIESAAFLKRLEESKTIARLQAAQDMAAENGLKRMMKLEPRDFEDHITAMFQRLGYQAKRTPYSNDGGYDILIVKDNIREIVECKRWSTNKPVGRPELQRFRSAMLDQKVTSGLFVTTSGFSKQAKAYINTIKDLNIELIDGQTLKFMMQESLKASKTASNVKS